MRRWLIGILLVILSVGLNTVDLHAETQGTTKVVIHYQPAPGDTTDWSLWVWGEGEPGARYPFTGVDEQGAKTAQIELEGDFAKVGFIVSTEDWIKDGGDRFIDIADGIGEIHVIGGGAETTAGGGNGPILWLIVGVLSAVVWVTVMEHLRKLRMGRKFGSRETQA